MYLLAALFTGNTWIVSGYLVKHYFSLPDTDDGKVMMFNQADQILLSSIPI